jgi:hypothetical protein
MKKVGIILLLNFILISCKSVITANNSSTVKANLNYKPKREAYAGFVWEKVVGAGIEFWAQRSKDLSVGISETLPGAFIEKQIDGKSVAVGLVIQVFPLKNKKIEDVLEFIQNDENWNQEGQCVFYEITSNRKGVKRYELRPSGKALEEYNKLANQEPITHTCAIWGSGNSGIRYFEIHDTNKNKAIFLEVGQEAPLFDEESIIVK